MNKAKLLKILDLLEESFEDSAQALEAIEDIKDAKVKERAKSIVQRISEQFINKQFAEDNINRLNEQILQYAQNNYYCEVPLTEQNDSLDSLITSMNMLGEEINYSTVSRIYFTDIYNTIPDYVLVVDEEGQINNANQTFLNAFQLKEKALIQKHNICDFIKDECSYTHLVSAITDGDNYRTLQIEGQGEMPITIKMGDFTESDQGKACRVFILRDFTEVMRYQKDLESALDKAQESDRLKSAFLANMSHEIRTPMNGILGFTDLLKTENISNEKRLQFIELIQTSGNRMLSTVNDIIETSKIQAGQMTLIMSEFDLLDEFDNLCKFFQLEAEKKGLILRVNKELEIGKTRIKTDKSKLLSILTNLLKNAIKFTDRGTITVDCRKVNNAFTCTISDTGIGIPKDRQKAIFESFVQADIEDIRAFQGSGLGLSISKAYIDMLGGDIHLSSTEGKGSSFSFSIPWLNNDDKYTRIEDFNSTDTSNSEWKILIAEDDTTNYEYLKGLLDSKSRQILWAKTGVESLNFVKTQMDIDFVLMDIRMPGMDGYEATKRIKKLRPELPVIAQTAYALPEDKEKALRAGCNGFLAKPLDINKLKNILKNL